MPTLLDEAISAPVVEKESVNQRLPNTSWYATLLNEECIVVMDVKKNLPRKIGSWHILENVQG